MAGTCVLLHEQMDALLLAGLFLRGGAIGLLTLQAMTAALKSTPKFLATAGILERISAMPGSAAVPCSCTFCSGRRGLFPGTRRSGGNGEPQRRMVGTERGFSRVAASAGWLRQEIPPE